MITILAIIIGALAALALVSLARTKTRKEELHIYALGLLIAALIYVLFGILGGASAYWLMLEILGVVFYGGLALIGLRRYPLLIALGWLGHIAWDAVLHLSGEGAAYTPAWYPFLCLSFDLVIAVAAQLTVKGDPGKYIEQSING